MGKNRVFAVDTLNEELLAEAVNLKANTIVCNEKVCDVSAYTGIEFINSEVYRIPGTFKAYSYNRKLIDQLYSRYANKFIINGFNIQKAVLKLVYWTNYRIGYLHACIEDRLDRENIVYITSYLPVNKIRETLKYLKYYVSNNLKKLLHRNKGLETTITDKKTGLLVNDEFELTVFEYLIKAIRDSELVIFYYGNIDFGKYPYISDKVKKVDVSHIHKYSLQKFINPLGLSAEELALVNIIARDWQNISNEIELYKYIKSTSLESLIIIAGENLPVKNLMTDVFNDSIKVYNTMNGMKSGEAHDGDVYFTKWLVWDEQMKRMLVEKCGLDESKLSVTGHLMKDFVRDYHFRNTAGISREKLRDKKVISLFSVRGNREEKQETFNYLYELLGKDDSFFLFVRPHPLERQIDFVPPPGNVKNIHFVEYHWENSKQTLYDQIYLSDIGIVFGSTVAIECQWMNVPVLTFEKKEESNIYGIDDIHIKHIKSIDELRYQLEKLQKKIMKSSSEYTESVAEKILEVINHD